MTILSDNEIKQLLTRHPTAIVDFPYEAGFSQLPLQNAAWNRAESPIQPASIDLHIGKIFVPGAAPGALGSHECPHHSFALEAGMSVVVLSHEILQFPRELCAIALPPSRISSAGILIANFGHIDPGYHGHLRFTLINMGKEPFNLERGALVMTLLLMRLGHVDADFSDRVAPRVDDRPTAHEINRLAPDFANVEQRATMIAKQQVDKSGARGEVLRYILPLVLTLLIALGGAAWSFKSSVDAELRRIDAFDNERAVLTEKVRALAERTAERRIVEEKLQHLWTDVEKLKNGESQR